MHVQQTAAALNIAYITKKFGKKQNFIVKIPLISFPLYLLNFVLKFCSFVTEVFCKNFNLC